MRGAEEAVSRVESQQKDKESLREKQRVGGILLTLDNEIRRAWGSAEVGGRLRVVASQSYLEVRVRG